MNVKKTLAIWAFVLPALLASCGGKSNISLSGTGATFPAPFYNDVTKQYGESHGIRVSYGGTGSGAGIRNLQDMTVEFGGTDIYLSEKELAAMPGEVLHIPTCIGGIVMSYNIEGITELNLTPKLITKIYLGEITNWNDPLIAAVNEGTKFPDQEITVVYRSEGSGSTAVFTGFMSSVNAEWEKAIGKGKSVNFPMGIAAKGNPGVAGIISETNGAIGYIGSEYSLALQIPSARIQNRAGKFIEANMESISLSGNIENMPNDTRMIISNSDNERAYPISTFTWLIVYKEQAYNGRTLEQAQTLQDFLLYVIGKEGAESASKTHFAPLPEIARAKAEAVVKSMTYEGKPLR